MKKIISFVHLSLDGFVAGPNGEMDWIKIDEELFDHVGKRISKGDTALYGRKTFELMESYWPTAADKPNATRHDLEHSKWYAQSHKVVLSKTLDAHGFGDDSRTDTSRPGITIISNQLAERLHEIKRSDKGRGEEILLFGSPTATHALIELDLIDGYWLFVNPILLGKGIPLFAQIKNQVNLKLLNTRTFNSGVTELDYLVIRS